MSSEKDKVNNFSYSPNLFKRDDGTPMEFYINYSSDSKDFAPLIREGGGIIVDNIDNADVRNSRIICLASNAKSLQTGLDLVCSSFIYASCINDRCLDPKDFWLQPLEKSRADSIESESFCKSSPNERIAFDCKMLWSIVKYLANEQDIWKSICVNNKEFGDVSWKTVRMKFILWAFNCLKLNASEQLYSRSTPVSSQSINIDEKDKHLDENISQEDLGESIENPTDGHSDIIKEPNVKEQISEPLPLKKQLRESVDGGNNVNKESNLQKKLLLRNELRKTRIKRIPPNCESDKRSTSRKGSDTHPSFSGYEEECNSAAAHRQFFRTSTPASSPSKDKHLNENISQEDLGESIENPKDGHSDIIKEPNVKEQINEPLPLKEQRKESVNGRNKVGKRESEWLGKDFMRDKVRKRLTNGIPPDGQLDDGSTSTDASDTDQSFNTDQSCSTDDEESVIAIRRKPRSYSSSEDFILLKWIILRRNSVTSLTGNRIWQFMEKRKVLPNRTWQSMRERFRKRIMPNIKKYPLSKEEFDQLRQVKQLKTP